MKDLHRDDIPPHILRALEEKAAQEFPGMKIAFPGDMPEGCPELDEIKQKMRQSLEFGRCVACGEDYPGAWPLEELEDGWEFCCGINGEPFALHCGHCPDGAWLPGDVIPMTVQVPVTPADELLRIFKMTFIDTGKITNDAQHRAMLQVYLIGASALAYLGNAPVRDEIDELAAEVCEPGWRPYGKFL